MGGGLFTDHPDGAVTDFGGKTGLSWHDSNLSGYGVSGKPGAIQSGDTVFVGASFTRGLLAQWVVGRDTMHAEVLAPEWIWRRRIPAMRYGRTEALVLGDSVLFAVAGVDGILVATREGQVRRVLTFPARRRRGIPADLVASARARRAENDLAPAGSSVIGFGRLSSAEIVVVYVDLDQLQSLEKTSAEVRRMPTFGNYRVWATVIRPDLRAACVDGAVPIRSDGYPAMYFSGDTVRVVTRLLEADSVVTRVTAFTIDTAECECLRVEANAPEG
jgi:hypothetical protein